MGGKSELKTIRRQDAEQRNAKWEKLSLTEQLKVLQKKFPDGAQRQKARLAARIEAAKNTPLASPEAKKDRLEEEKKKLSSREKKQEEMKSQRLDGRSREDGGLA